MKIPFFKPFSNSLKKELENSIIKVFNEGKHINGPQVKELEQRIEHYLGINHCIACANGSDALLIALQALDLEKGSEVIIPSFNYVSSAEASKLLGLKPVFCDVNDDGNTTLDLIKNQWSRKTKAVIITHLFGLGVEETENIRDFCDKNNAFLVEDNAQSFGAKIGDRFTGTFGHISTTSFFPTKNLACAGDGGAIFTNDTDLAHKVRMLCSHGQSSKYNYKLAGYNSRLDTIQAGILILKLDHLDRQIKMRKENAHIYLSQLSSIESIKTPKAAQHTYNQFVIRSENRDQLKKHLEENGVPSMIYYPAPLHLQTAYLIHDKLPMSEQLCKESLALPIFPELETEDILYISRLIKAFYQ